MNTIMKALAALMLLTGGYHADSMNAQEHAATDSVTATIMRIRDEMPVVCDTTTNFMFSGVDKLTDADPHAYWLMSRMMETMSARVTSRLHEELKELRNIRY